MTNENLSELLSALGQDAAPREAETDERFREILADLARRPIPTNALHRLWTMGELSAQVAMAYGALWVRGWFSSAEAKKRRAMETNLRIALKLFHRLAYLRGAMTKLGQTAGQLPDIVPAEIAEVLDRLHSEAPPMHYSLVREVVANEFGREVEDVFGSFEKEAFAAASIGQVHRARLRTGEEVAVKIQYPGIARTIDADFRNLGALLFPVRLSPDWEYVKAQFEEVRRMLRQEVDYRQEAASQRRAGALFDADEGIVVPRVFEEYSTERVLTTEFLAGRHLNDFLAANPPQAVRDHSGSLISRAQLRMYYAYMNYGDPNPGNYLFLEDGRIGLLDFGCVQHHGAEEREIVALCEDLIQTGVESPRLLELVCGLRPTDPEYERYIDLIHRSRDWMMEPMKIDGPFDYSDEGHLERGVAVITDMLRRRQMRGHPMYVYYNRCVYGEKAMLYRLRARINIREQHAEESERWRRSAA